MAREKIRGTSWGEKGMDERVQVRERKRDDEKMQTSHRGRRQRAAARSPRKINLFVSVSPFPAVPPCVPLPPLVHSPRISSGCSSATGIGVELPSGMDTAGHTVLSLSVLSFTLAAGGFTGRRIQCGPVRVHPPRPGAVL